VKPNPTREPISSPAVIGNGKKDGPLQTLLTECALEALERQLKNPLRLDAVDLGGIVTRGVTMLSEMSAELGVVLRIRVRGENVPVQGDYEKIRRSINALIVYLLTLSQSQACVTVVVEDRMQNGKRGMSALLSSNNVVVPWKPELGMEDELANSQEVSTCRLLLEKNGGSLSVQLGEGGGPSFLVWLPIKGPRGR